MDKTYFVATDRNERILGWGFRPHNAIAHARTNCPKGTELDVWDCSEKLFNHLRAYNSSDMYYTIEDIDRVGGGKFFDLSSKI